jgi:TonB-dependent starch-binding outer membrane protein SusC
MKCKIFNLRLSTICLILCLILSEWAVPVTAQQAKERIVTGKITDENSAPMIGVSIVVPGTTVATITDTDGKFSIKVPGNKSELRISFIGYEVITLAIPDNYLVNLQMKPQAKELDEIVVIGYGTQRKGDLTGSIASVSTRDFNKGIISSPEQLINGKISGVQVMSNNGSPTAGSTIRVRGGASLNASNDPLIVLDGVPLESGGISGNSNNFLSLINPNDIESMTVLKDASSTAIFGSRASNGVIIITTKKASNGKFKVNFSSTNSLQVKTKLADMLSTSEFRHVVETEGTAGQIALLGNTNTNWNDEIYKVAFGTDNNLSFSGSVKKVLPYRLSLGYYDQDGILKTDNSQRFTGNLSISPSLLKDQLKLTIGLKGSLNKNTFANNKAIWGGATFNPTIPIHSGTDAFGGYTEAIDGAGKPVTSAVINPVGLLNQYASTSDVSRFIGNFEADYKMPFMPELRFHVNMGYDYAEGKGQISVPASAAQYYTSGGRDYEYGPQKLLNKLLTTYFNYNKSLEAINSTVDVTAGYDYQYWKNTTSYYEELNVAGDVEQPTAATDKRHCLIAFYGRLNYNLATKYMVTATIRRDGTSRFSKDNRWGTFPSVALGWRISEESFLKNLNIFSNLKLRASYGVTGQQEGIGDYGYLPIYTLSQTGAQYIFGSDVINTYRPEAYISELKWESTKAYNFGFDFGFFKDRLTGSFEYYTRKTEDLFATVPSPAGTNFEKTVTTNVGNVDSKGYEVTLNVTPFDSKDFTWNASFNLSWQKQTIKNLSIVKGAAITNTSVGPTIDSYYFQVLTEGYAPNMFYVYHQLYDDKGKPIEGAYASIDGNNEINSSDLYRYHSPAPDYILGFSTSVRYKKLCLGTSLRANIGNYVYNGMSMNSGAFGTMSYNSYQLNNLNKSYLKTGFQSRQYLSDYYVENASFLKMDNLTLAYNLGEVIKNCNLNVSGMIQNVFTITKYTGVDPEVPNGMDNTFYPRPRIFSISLGLDF